MHPSVDFETSARRPRDPGLWTRLGVAQPYRLLYAGHVCQGKNLGLLVEAFKRLCQTRDDVALIVVGEGRFRSEMRRALANHPAYFPDRPDDEDALHAIYAGSDLFVFPGRTDRPGTVIEALACGLPVLVGEEGAAKKFVEHGRNGRFVAGDDATAWAEAIDDLLDDAPCRLRMARAASADPSRHRQRSPTFRWRYQRRGTAPHA